MRRLLIASGLATFALALAPGVGAAQTSPAAGNPRAVFRPSIRPYVVWGVSSREERSLLVSEGFDIGERAWADHVELFGTRTQALALSVSGYRVIPEAVHTPAGPRPDDFPPGYEDYHNYAEMVQDVQDVAAAHPDIAHVFSLGTSYEGRDIIGIRISNDATDNLHEPGVFFVGQHHAREHLTVEVVLGLIHMFAEDPKLRSLVDTRQIYLVPSLNPDGSEYDIQSGNFVYWRKNRQPYQGIYGTDNNRNYSYRWGCCGGSSSDPNSEVYRGPFPLSTPEDQAMANFMLAHRNVTTGISYHTYGELVLYPYGYTYQDIPPDMTVIDHSTFVAMAQEMGRTTGYTPEQSSDLYITDGDWNDWMYGALHRYPFTIEGADYGYGFYPPEQYIPTEVEREKRAAIFDAMMADCPTKIVGVPCTNPR